MQEKGQVSGTWLLGSFQAIRCTLVEMFHDACAEIIELPCAADIQRGNQPRYEELRERKQVSKVHWSNAPVHELREVTHRNWQKEVINDEGNYCGNDELCLGD